MAEVQVNVGSTRRRVHPVERTVRWADRAMLGIVMGVAAYAIERAVVRGTKRANEEPDAASTNAGG